MGKEVKIDEKKVNKKDKNVEEKKRIAVVRVRGNVHMKRDIKDTLNKLNLTRVNHCVIIDSRKEYKGMINKVKDYVTYGEVSQDILERLIKERGKIKGDSKGRITDDYVKKKTKFKSINDFVKNFMEFKVELKDLGIKQVFRLQPPRKGYERKGIKKPYSLGGALGYRGEKINSLLERML